jgi:hypothetical protein
MVRRLDRLLAAFDRLDERTLGRAGLLPGGRLAQWLEKTWVGRYRRWLFQQPFMRGSVIGGIFASLFFMLQYLLLDRSLDVSLALAALLLVIGPVGAVLGARLYHRHSE